MIRTALLDGGGLTLLRALNITTFQHERNLGYGRNQKTCHRETLKREADIAVMLHPDYRYSPKLVTSLAGMIASGHYDVALVLGVGSLKGGMPRKYISNRFLTAAQNLLLGCSRGSGPFHLPRNYRAAPQIIFWYINAIFRVWLERV